MDTDKLIARQVKAGTNPEDSRAALARILRDHTGHNLAFALVHEGFATERQAYAFLDSIPRPLGWSDMGSSAKDLWEDRYMADLAHRVEAEGIEGWVIESGVTMQSGEDRIVTTFIETEGRPRRGFNTTVTEPHRDLAALGVASCFERVRPRRRDEEAS